MGLTWSDTQAEQCERTYGWKRDLPDKRDYYHSFKDIVRDDIPNKVDLRDNCPPIYNQGKLGSCTANAIAAAYQFDEMLQGEKEIMTPSRLFIYYNERDLEGHVDTDSGAMIRDGMKTIGCKGVCSENSWPYDISIFKCKPKSKCYKEAENHKAVSYRRVPQSLTAMKACLKGGLPFVFGFTVYESFESKELEQTGIMSMPKEDEKMLGGHAVMAVGYCDVKKCMIIRNSWGTEWGEAGYFYMPYKFIRDTGYCSDFWTIRKVHDVACGPDGDDDQELTEDDVTDCQ